MPYIAFVGLTYGLIAFWLSYVRMVRDGRTPAWYRALVAGMGLMTTLIWAFLALGLKLGLVQ